MPPMHVLLDENLPRQLARSFDARHVVRTVADCGWQGKRNGELLRLAAADFDAFVTTDKGIPYEQNLQGLDLGILVLRSVSNRLPDLLQLMPSVHAALESLVSGDVREIRGSR